MKNFVLSVKIRFAYAVDQGDYAVACDDEASEHYQEPRRSGVSRNVIWLKGFMTGLHRRIPEYFIEQWFMPDMVH